MTLIVCKKLENRIVIVSDTRVTINRPLLHNSDKNLTKELLRPLPSIDNEILKVLILSPEICVGFAGCVDRALEILRAIFDSNHHLDINNLLHTLNIEVIRSVSDKKDVEFVVGYAHNDSCDLYLVQNSTIKNLEACWIGSKVAFHSFQERMSKIIDSDVAKQENYPSNSLPLAHLGFMKFVLERVIEVDLEDKKGKTQNEVGGLVIAVQSTASGFKYLVQSVNSHGIHSDVVTTTTGVSANPIIDEKSMDGSDKGGYSYSIFTPDASGQSFIGVYIYQNKLGILYAPLVSDTMIEFPNVSLDDFVESVKLAYSVTLKINGIN